MSSYVLMKLLESRAPLYDRGLDWLTFGHASRIKRRIAEEEIGPGQRVLEIGVGTGTLAILAARRGAAVVGFDIEPKMLEVARAKVRAAGVAEAIELREMGVGSMDQFPDACFDRVVAALVLSELSPQARSYAVREAVRVLRPGGRLIVADETRPRRRWLRWLQTFWRTPLALVTWLATGAWTEPIEDPEKLLSDAHLTLQVQQRSLMGCFVYLVGVKE